MRAILPVFLTVCLTTLAAPAEAAPGHESAQAIKRVSRARRVTTPGERSVKLRRTRKNGRSRRTKRLGRAELRRLRRISRRTGRRTERRSRANRQRRGNLRRKSVGPSGDPIAELPGGKRGRIVFGVMGGAGKTTPKSVERSVSELGGAIADANGVILTGAAPGIPDIAVRAAREKGASAIGISPYKSMAEHEEAKAPTNFDVMKFTEHPALRGQKRPNYMGREIDNIEHSDVIIVAGGRFGTLGELAVALDEGKPVGVLTGTGGISGIVKEIVKASTAAGKRPRIPVVYDSNPQNLVRKLTEAKQQYDSLGETGPLGDTAK